MNAALKYLVFVVLIVVFNCILIGVFKWNLHEVELEIKNDASCGAEACIKICCVKNVTKCVNEEDKFDDIDKLGIAKKLTKNYKLINGLVDGVEFLETEPWIFLRVSRVERLKTFDS